MWEILIGAASGLFGIFLFAIQLWKKKKRTEEYEEKLEEVKEKREKLEKEKEDLVTEKEEYEEMIDETRSIIKELQGVIKKDEEEFDRCELGGILDRLEETVLPEKQQILSKLDRLQTNVRDDEVLSEVKELKESLE